MDLRDFREFCIDAFKYIFTIFIVIFILVFVATLQQVVGSSMAPNYKDNDIVLLNKFYYRFFDVKRFDIISFEYDNTKYLIKRVIGLPGERIEYKNNKLYVDGKVIEEGFLENDVITEDFSILDLGYDVIPEDMYLVLGDNRGNSLDSREIGLIKKSDILGKANLRIWPINKIGFVKWQNSTKIS